MIFKGRQLNPVTGPTGLASKPFNTQLLRRRSCKGKPCLRRRIGKMKAEENPRSIYDILSTLIDEHTLRLNEDDYISTPNEKDEDEKPIAETDFYYHSDYTTDIDGKIRSYSVTVDGEDAQIVLNGETIYEGDIGTDDYRNALETAISRSKAVENKAEKKIEQPRKTEVENRQERDKEYKEIWQDVSDIVKEGLESVEDELTHLLNETAKKFKHHITKYTSEEHWYRRHDFFVNLFEDELTNNLADNYIEVAKRIKKNVIEKTLLK